MTAAADFVSGESRTIRNERGDRLDLLYENNAGTARVHRTWLHLGDQVREVTVEQGLHYEDGWEWTYRYTRDYPITPDGDLIGDGSNWDGTGRRWDEWAEERHLKLLSLRFPYDEVDR